MCERCFSDDSLPNAAEVLAEIAGFDVPGRYNEDPHEAPSVLIPQDLWASEALRRVVACRRGAAFDAWSASHGVYPLDAAAKFRSGILVDWRGRRRCAREDQTRCQTSPSGYTTLTSTAAR